jgi:putative membrane-bound dehydrogenase-like protein
MRHVLALAAGLAFAPFAFAEAPPPPGKTAPLFGGKTLDGWEGDPKLWRVEDGCLTGGSVNETMKRNEFLASTKDFGNFIVRFKIKLTGKEGFVNSGFQIRSQRVPNNSEMSGYQCDFGEPNWYGAIYDESRRNKVMAASDMAALRPVLKQQDWNDYVIRAQGPRITTWINGVQGCDYTEADAAIARRGKFGIQVHGGGKAMVQVKDVTIEELEAPKPGEIFEGALPAKKGAKASPLSPEDERAAFLLPPGFEIELIASESEGIGKFVPITFDQKGALWTTTALEYPVDGNENPAAADALYASKAKDKVVVFDRDPKSPTGYASKPRVFAEGLAIPLGVLPYKNGCYVQHGHDIAFLSDTDGDGKADKREVILTGFGVQDSHLFPHQFTRAPGGWIWMAQGAFNYSKVRRPDDPPEKAVKFDQTRMARFRPDGSGFDITSNGPCNIWGLVIDGLGQTWIQEANDFGYPVMPFHEYGNYPGCSNAQWKSYAPEFPGTARGWSMGGTGLSGLGLSDATGGWPGAYANVMYVANPITRQIQAIRILRDGARFSYEKLPDFINSRDEWFRPVAMTFGPDGCLYIIDWYNKIISHNEVPRNHPERDKIRGRIWRVKATTQKPHEVPDFTKAGGDELLAKLGGPSVAQSHLAWQAIVDRGMKELVPQLQKLTRRIDPEDHVRKTISDPPATATRIAAFWALEGLDALNLEAIETFAKDSNRNVRREAIRAAEKFAPQIQWPTGGNGNPAYTLAQAAKDADPEVRATVARVFGNALGKSLSGHGDASLEGHIGFEALLSLAREPLAAPVAPSTQNGKPMKVGEAYEREFERYLVRMFLEKQPEQVGKYLDSPAAAKQPVEARLLASLALEPKASAARVARLLPQLTRPAGDEELLRLAQFPEEAGVSEALKAVLQNPATRDGALESLLKVRTKLDAAKIAPLLTDAAKQLIGGKDEASVALGARLADAFQLAGTEEALLAAVQKGTSETHGQFAGEPGHRTWYDLNAPALQAVKALRSLRSENVDLFWRLAVLGTRPEVRSEGLLALSASKSPKASDRLLELWPRLEGAERRSALEKLTTTKPGAKTVVAAIKSGAIAKADLDGPTIEKLQTLLGANDPDLTPLLNELAALFRPVLLLNGSDDAWTETGLTLDGPFTAECWVRLDAGIDNNDGILGSPGQLDINFFAATLRVWVGGLHDVIISKKPMTADLWTHVAVTRDERGMFKIYQDGELASDQSKPAPQKFENVRIGWTAPAKGTAGALSEFRIWKSVRTADEIRRDFDRTFAADNKPANLVLLASGADGWGQLRPGAKIAKTSDFPPVMSAGEAHALDEKFTKFRALAQKPGDAARGKTVTVVCQACHLFKGQGASIGPDLSGIGAMGDEGILRNILTPNAAMENGYRIYRVELKNGDLLDSFFVSEDKDAVVIRQPGVPDRRVAKSEIRSTKYLRRSLMPEGLLDGMTPEQVSDLFTYLRSMK